MSERAQVEKPEETTDGGGAFVWFLAGSLVGAVIALLLAPSSGRATRERLAETGRDIYGRSSQYYTRGRELVEDAADLFERGRKLASRDLD
jgi:gas vesicle protein